MFLVSACLCGVNCKYNGGNNYNEKICKLYNEGKAVLICPETLGGLKTPRTPSEINKCNAKDVLKYKGKVVNAKGEDVTEEFLFGAIKSLGIAKEMKCKTAILKSKSPSCGCGKVYDGTFTGKLVDGNGITAELLIQNGINVITDEEFNITEEKFKTEEKIKTEEEL